MVRVLSIGAAAQSAFLGARALLTVTELRAKQGVQADPISETFGLTRAETRVASLIANGLSIQQVAGRSRHLSRYGPQSDKGCDGQDRRASPKQPCRAALATLGTVGNGRLRRFGIRNGRLRNDFFSFGQRRPGGSEDGAFSARLLAGNVRFLAPSLRTCPSPSGHCRTSCCEPRRTALGRERPIASPQMSGF